MIVFNLLFGAVFLAALITYGLIFAIPVLIILLVGVAGIAIAGASKK